MTTNANHEQQARRLLEAAEGLLAAREDQMVTAVEWDALRQAAEACRRTLAPATPAELGCEFCRAKCNRPAGRFMCPYCRWFWIDDPDAVIAGRIYAWNPRMERVARAILKKHGVALGHGVASLGTATMTGRQYDALLTDLCAAGRPGKEWAFQID